MRQLVLALAVSMGAAGAASAQGAAPDCRTERLSGQVYEFEFVGQPADFSESAAPQPATGDRGGRDYSPCVTVSESPPPGRRLRSSARLLQAVPFDAAVVPPAPPPAAAGLLEGTAAATIYPPYAYGRSPFVPSSRYGYDSCVHAYTMASCPFSSTGTSYGSMYLSGRGELRMRPDHMGGYRYYMSNGAYGTMRPTYGGGYRVTGLYRPHAGVNNYACADTRYRYSYASYTPAAQGPASYGISGRFPFRNGRCASYRGW